MMTQALLKNLALCQHQNMNPSFSEKTRQDYLIFIPNFPVTIFEIEDSPQQAIGNVFNVAVQH